MADPSAGNDSGSSGSSEDQAADSLVAMAVLNGWVSDEQISQAEQICEKLKADGMVLTTLEALLKKGYLSAAQVEELEKKRRAARLTVAIEGYEILSRLGKGAMGHVFKALQKNMGKTVAIKILHPTVAKQEGLVERFVREARASALFSHPHIINGLDVGESNGLHYFVMEYVEGETLRARLEREKRLAEPEVLKIALQMASALEAAGKAGIVHRDIKPENIMLAKDGNAKLCDLGLTRHVQEDSSLTQTGAAMGTPLYMAPEQAQGRKDLDPRADQYALGATLYHLLTGQPLFSGDTSAKIMTAHVLEEAQHPQKITAGIGNGMVAILRKMLAKNPVHRYASATEVKQDLEDYGQGRPVRAFLHKDPSSIPPGFSEPGTQSDKLALDMGPAVPAETKGAAGTTKAQAVATSSQPRGMATSQHGAVRRTRARPTREASTAPMSSQLKVGIGVGIGALLIAGLYAFSGGKPEADSRTAAQGEISRKKPASIPDPKRTESRKPPEPSVRPPETEAPETKQAPAQTPPAPPETTPPAPVPAAPNVSEPAPTPPPDAQVQDKPPVMPPQPAKPQEPDTPPPVPVTEKTPLQQEKGPWVYRFAEASELRDWRQVEPGWASAGGLLTCAHLSLVQRLEWNREWSGDTVVRIVGFTRSDLGLFFVEAAHPENYERIVLGGIKGQQGGIFCSGTPTPKTFPCPAGDGRLHQVEVTRAKGQLSVALDGKQLAQQALAGTLATGRFKLMLCLWECGGSFKEVAIETTVAPAAP